MKVQVRTKEGDQKRWNDWIEQEAETKDIPCERIKKMAIKIGLKMKPLKIQLIDEKIMEG